MCGGYSISAGAKLLKARFSAEPAENLNTPVYNARPGQMLPIISCDDQDKIVNGFWGYAPHFIEKPKSKSINTRSESVFEKNFFADSVKNRRCLVIADGFYEWKASKNGKQPYRFIAKDKRIFAFAGIWDYPHNNKNNKLPGFSIITVPANKETSVIHDRMPLILQQEDESIWINKSTSPEMITNIMKGTDNDILDYYPVSKRINIPANNDASLLVEINI